MIFHILAVGRVRQAALREACEAYLARAGRYFKLKVLEVPDATRGGRTGGEAMRAEGVALLKKIPADATAVAGDHRRTHLARHPGIGNAERVDPTGPTSGTS